MTDGDNFTHSSLDLEGDHNMWRPASGLSEKQAAWQPLFSLGSSHQSFGVTNSTSRRALMMCVLPKESGKCCVLPVTM